MFERVVSSLGRLGQSGWEILLLHFSQEESGEHREIISQVLSAHEGSFALLGDELCAEKNAANWQLLVGASSALSAVLQHGGVEKAQRGAAYAQLERVFDEGTPFARVCAALGLTADLSDGIPILQHARSRDDLSHFVSELVLAAVLSSDAEHTCFQRRPFWTLLGRLRSLIFGERRRKPNLW